METDLLIVGGGVAGLSAAISAVKNGIKNIIIIEKDKKLGGVLNQCIHSGFGRLTFNEELTGNEYAKKFIDSATSKFINFLTNTTVLKIKIEKKEIYAVSPIHGYFNIKFKALILATGCYEEIGSNIPGSRPAGVMTAGMAQKFINIHGFFPGKNVIIFGTNIVGLTFARRLTLEGAKVLCLIEDLPYCRGPLRDEYLCINDFNIPFYYSHIVTKIYGKGRISKIEVAKVDENFNLIKDSNFELNLDCLLIARNLIPDNNLINEIEGINIDEKTNGPIVDQNMQTAIPFVFACGNNVYIHNNVDTLVKESNLAGKAAANFINNFKINNNLSNPRFLKIKLSKHFNFVSPQIINLENLNNVNEIYLKPNNVYKNVTIVVELLGNTILQIKKEQIFPSTLEKIILLKKDFLTVKQLKDVEICICIENTNNTVLKKYDKKLGDAKSK